MTHEHHQLDALPLVELGAQLGPGGVREVLLGVQLVGGPKQQPVATTPLGSLRPGGHPVDLLGGQPGPAAEPTVLGQLVVVACKRGHPEDHQLGLPAWQSTARHQRPGEQQPAPEQPSVPAEGEEDARRLGAGHPAGETREARHQQPGLPDVAGRDPRGRAAHTVSLRVARATSGSTLLAPTFMPCMARV